MVYLACPKVTLWHMDGNCSSMLTFTVINTIVVLFGLMTVN